MLLQGRGEGGTAAHPPLQGRHDPDDLFFLREVDQDLEGAVQGQTGLQQGRELPGQHGDLFRREGAHPTPAQPVAEPAGRSDLKWNQALPLELPNHGRLIGRLQLTLRGLAVLTHRLVGKPCDRIRSPRRRRA